MTSEPRPLQHLSLYGSRYPNAWKFVDQFRAQKGKILPFWPNWCYCPLDAANAAMINISGSIKTESQITGALIIGALSAWRQTKGIYRFDSTILDALWETPITGDIPIEVLHHLPEWCVYIETLGKTAFESELHGFYAHLDFNTNNHETELYFLLDTSVGLVPFSLPLGGSLKDSIERVANTTIKMVPTVKEEIDRLDVKNPKYYEPWVSVLLYLCSQAAEIRDTVGTNRQPKKPKSQPTKFGIKTYAATSPTAWEVAFRLGAALRTAQNREKEKIVNESEPHASLRPHIRRAHWHTFWTGSRNGERQAHLKWLPPIPVNVSEENPTIPVVRFVE